MRTDTGTSDRSRTTTAINGTPAGLADYDAGQRHPAKTRPFMIAVDQWSPRATHPPRSRKRAGSPGGGHGLTADLLRTAAGPQFRVQGVAGRGSAHDSPGGKPCGCLTGQFSSRPAGQFGGHGLGDATAGAQMICGVAVGLGARHGIAGGQAAALGG
jgi:hypothetical protein